MNLLFELVAVGVLIMLNGFFVASEYALVTARRTRIHELAEGGSRTARAVQRIVSNPPRFIAAMQLGVTLTSLGIGALGEPVLSEIFDEWLAALAAVLLAFLIITFLHVVVGELVPKGIALNYSERVALAVSTPVRGFFVLFKPLIWVLQRSSEALQRLIGVDPYASEHEAHSEAELKMLLNVSSERGEIEHDEREMLYKVFDFADKEAEDVMVPRPEVTALSISLPPEQALAAVIDSPFTRYPVYRDSLDDVVGVLHVRDLFSALHERGLESTDLRTILREAIMVPETKPLDELLAEFQRTSNHLAIVVDEYGSVEGLVTLEDLLEEIVGEIGDEFDLPDAGILRIGRGRVRLVGSFPIEEFNERFGKSLPLDDYHTIGGFVFGEVGRVPKVGDTVVFDGARFEVSAIDGSRIREVDVTLTATAPQPARPPAQGE